MTFQTAQMLYWLVAVLGVGVIGTIGGMAVKLYRTKETLKQVDKNTAAIKALQEGMEGIKGDISDIKVGVDRNGEDMAAVLCAMQSIMTVLQDRNCDIGPAREKFNDHLAKR